VRVGRPYAERMTARRGLAIICVVAALVAVGFGVAFTAIVAADMSAVNAANHWLPNNPAHEALGPLDYLVHSVPALVLIGASFVSFARARSTIWVGYVLIWVAALAWIGGFLLYAIYAEHAADSSFLIFAGSATAAAISALASVAVRVPARADSRADAGLSAPTL
jgi:hypothetical protein